MPWDSPDRVEFYDLIKDAYDRYKKPMVVTETGCFGTLRKKWWGKILKETATCLDKGMPIYGLCSYPTLDRPYDVPLFEPQSGLWDFEQGDNTFKRIPHAESLILIKEFITHYQR
jgi:beta-glucosidase/6-phospho-beta-glucosidase/beta-galactosidase